MNRRKFLAGVGATATGGAVATGTGAFTSVDADRTVSVAVADEETSSYLVLDSLAPGRSENGSFSSNGGGSSGVELELDFNQNIPTSTNSEGGEGPGKNSVYEFDEVFEVENQGTQTVDVGIETLTDSDFEDSNGNSPSDTLEMSFYPDSNASSPLETNPVSISPGNAQTVGVKIDLGDVAFDDFSAEATVKADADSGQITF
jgi:hypothetical protein